MAQDNKRSPLIRLNDPAMQRRAMDAVFSAGPGAVRGAGVPSGIGAMSRLPSAADALKTMRGAMSKAATYVDDAGRTMANAASNFANRGAMTKRMQSAVSEVMGGPVAVRPAVEAGASRAQRAATAVKDFFGPTKWQATKNIAKLPFKPKLMAAGSVLGIGMGLEDEQSPLRQALARQGEQIASAKGPFETVGATLAAPFAVAPAAIGAAFSPLGSAVGEFGRGLFGDTTGAADASTAAPAAQGAPLDQNGKPIYVVENLGNGRERLTLTPEGAKAMERQQAFLESMPSLSQSMGGAASGGSPYSPEALLAANPGMTIDQLSSLSESIARLLPKPTSAKDRLMSDAYTQLNYQYETALSDPSLSNEQKSKLAREYQSQVAALISGRPSIYDMALTGDEED